MKIKAVIFDKDGTLFDFQATWGHWTGQVLRRLSRGNNDLRNALAQDLNYDAAAKKILPGSLVVAGTPAEIADVIYQHLPHLTISKILTQLNQEAEIAPQVVVTDLSELAKSLRYRDLKLSIMTNDSERPAKAHLASVGASSVFDFVIGSDSGFGAKPNASPLLALADMMQVDPAECVMVGDSTHDLRAARAAGMPAVAVLTGLACMLELAPLADAVLQDVTCLSAWIDQQNS